MNRLTHTQTTGAGCSEAANPNSAKKRFRQEGIKSGITLFLIVITGITITGYSQTVTLDNTFGQNGIARFSKGREIKCFDFDTQGNIIAVGYDELSDGSPFLMITKANADGVLDESFGNNGFVAVTEYGQIMPLALKIKRDNKICIIGDFPVLSQGYEHVLIQLNEDGSIDDDFGNNGKVNLTLNIGFTISLNVDNDDFMLMARRDYQDVYHIVKCNYDGEIDETFGENGTVTLTNYVRPYCMKILNDGSIVVAGYYYGEPDRELGLCKLKSNGELDTDFAGTGIWHKNITNYSELDHEYFSNVLEDSEGNLMLSGSGVIRRNSGPPYRSFLSKFTPDGILDTGFGEDGFYCSELMGTNKPIFQIGNQYLIVGNFQYYYNKITMVSNDGKVGNEVYTCEIYDFQDMKLQGTNKIVLGGSYDIRANTPANFALERAVVDVGTQGNDTDFGSNTNAPVIYPNPAKEILYFGRETAFEILNLQGQILLKSETPVKLVGIGHLEAGIYFVRFAGSKSVRKLIKQ